MADLIASRTVLLETRQDRTVVEEGHRFLDEKRTLIARELLLRSKAYGARMAARAEAEQRARTLLRSAVRRHGLEGLQLHPVSLVTFAEEASGSFSFLGVRLVDEDPIPIPPEFPASPVASSPSPEARACARAWAALLREARADALAAANLLRLRDEYRRTERRVRALENVILPEIRADQRRIEELLEEYDQDETVRMHLFSGEAVRR